MLRSLVGSEMCIRDRSMARRLVNCSSAALQLEKKQSLSLRLDPYVSHREGSIVVLPAANLRGLPDKYGLLTLGRPSVRCCSALRAWSPVCGSTLPVSQAAEAMMAARDGRAYFIFFIFLECCRVNNFLWCPRTFLPIDDWLLYEGLFFPSYRPPDTYLSFLRLNQIISRP